MSAARSESIATEVRGGYGGAVGKSRAVRSCCPVSCCVDRLASYHGAILEIVSVRV